jgi:hypothetical protein
MDYLSRIDELRRAELHQRARTFAVLYDERLPTVMLLPGGMGSRLLRSSRRFEPDRKPKVEPLYELWLDFIPVLAGQLECLAMDEYGEERDQQPLVAAGELSSLIKSYDGVYGYLRGKANVLAFGYDWRRAPEKECGYVEVLLDLVAEEIAARNRSWNPARDLTLYAHSQGGLVAKMFIERLLQDGQDPLSRFTRLVTCCTPFYGTSSHLSRTYVGEAMANLFTGGGDEVAGIAASMEGPYILLPAPQAIVERRLAELGLERYPVRDRRSGAACDPFEDSAFVDARWRREISRAHLARAAEQFAAIDRALPQRVAERVFHLRSSLFAGAKTLELTWEQVRGSEYRAADGDPIATNEKEGGRGDGTVPFWSARLASTPDERVFDVVGVRHGSAAEHPTMLDILWRLVQRLPVSRGPHVAPPEPPEPAAARLEAIGAELELAEDPNERFAQLPKREQLAVARTLCLG